MNEELITVEQLDNALIEAIDTAIELKVFTYTTEFMIELKNGRLKERTEGQKHHLLKLIQEMIEYHNS